jgi:hypothetical protein
MLASASSALTQDNLTGSLLRNNSIIAKRPFPLALSGLNYN